MRPAPSAEGAFRFVCGLRIKDGRTWREAAHPFQLAAMRAALCNWTVPYYFWTRPRGGSKTFDTALICLAEMLILAPPESTLFVFAADREQGGLVVTAIREIVAHNPELKDLLRISEFKVSVVGYGSVLKIMAADTASAFGIRPYRLIVDELAQWNDTPASRELFEAVWTSLAKENGRMIVCTTPSGARTVDRPSASCRARACAPSFAL
jgi:phage terminase large subunit-like protein